MDNQRPAAPAVSLPMNRPRGSSIVPLPSKSNVWQRNYSPSVSQPTMSAPAVFSHGLASGHPIGNILYQSLQRPKLLRGGEWQLSVANNLMAAGLGTMALVTWNWRSWAPHSSAGRCNGSSACLAATTRSGGRYTSVPASGPLSVRHTAGRQTTPFHHHAYHPSYASSWFNPCNSKQHF